MKKVLFSLFLAFSCLPAIAQLTAGHEVKHIEKTTCVPYLWDLSGETYSNDTTVMRLSGDTIFILDLAFSSGVSVDSNIAANCVYVWRDSLVWKTPGLHTATVTDPAGCDSTYNFTLTLSNIDSSKVITRACDRYRSAWGEVFTADTIIDTTYTTAEGCQRNDTLHLSIFHSTLSPLATADTTCNYRWRNRTITSSGIYYDTLRTAIGRCDSVLRIQVTLSNHIVVNIDTTVCDQYLSPWNQTYTASAPLSHDSTLNNCVTTTNVNLTVNNSFKDTVAARTAVRDVTAGCFYKWGDSTLTDNTRAIHLATLTRSNGCDSIAAIRIVAYTNKHHDTTVVTACGDDSYRYSWRGSTYTSGNYTDSLTNDTTHCTNYYHLHLTINPEKDTTLELSPVCASTTFRTRHGRTASSPAAQQFVFTPADTANASSFSSYSDNGASVYSITTSIDPNGDSIFDINPASKCKRNYIAKLTIKAPKQLTRAKTDTVVACDKYTYRLTSNRTFTFTNETDSLYDTIIRVNAGQRNFYNCQDSIGHLVLTINRSSYEDTVVVACDSYHWPFNDTTYNRSITIARLKKDTAGNNVLNSVNCPINGQLRLTINKTPSASISGKWMLNPGESTVLRAVCTTPGVTYAWHRSDSPTVETTDSISIAAPANGNNIEVELITTSPVAPSYCAAHNWLTIATRNLGIDNTNSSNISLYPNPTSRILNISSDQPITNVTVFNAIGQQVIVRNNESTLMQLDLEQLAAGQYSMRVSTADGKQANHKFIVSK